MRFLPLVLVLSAAMLLSAASASSSLIPNDARGAPDASRPSAKLVPRKGVLFGAYVNQDNAWRGNDDAFAKVEAFEALIGRSLAIDLHYYAWTDVFPSGLEEWDVVHGRIPLVTWQGTSLDAINSGRYDSLIQERALGIRRLGAPVFVRWGWEMNGNWYAHSGPLNQPDGPAKFVAAWRRIHGIFDAAGATNAIWVWSPNAESSPNEPWNSWRSYYPGDAFVDWVGIDGYNWGRTQSWSTWRPLADVVRPIYRDYARRKPIMVAETASAETGGDKAGWIRAAGDALATDFPAVKALIWFEASKETDWRAESSPSSLSAFRSVVQASYFNAR